MRRGFYLLFFIFLGTGVSGAQEQAIGNFSGLGARAMGMGGAYLGVADDFSAVYWNPAGLAQMRQTEVYVSFLRNALSSEAALAGVRSSSTLNNTRFGSLGVVYPYPVYRGSLVFAAGFNRLKGFDEAIRIRGFSAVEELELDNFFRHEGELSTTSLAAALDLSPEISLGLALNLWRGEDERINEFEQVDTQDLKSGIRQQTRDLYSDSYDGLNLTGGVLLRSSRENPTVRLGLRVSSGVTHKIDYAFSGAPPPEWRYIEWEADRVIVEGWEPLGEVPDEERIRLVPDEEEITKSDLDTNSDLFVETNAGRRITQRQKDGETIVVEEFPVQKIDSSYELALPIEFGLGASFRPHPSLLLAGSVHLAEWSQAEYKGIDAEDLRANVLFEEEYEDIIRYHLGLEWQVPVITLALRAGYYSDPEPYIGPLDEEGEGQGNTHLILIREDRRFFTLGAGMVFDQVMQVDLAWSRGSFEQSREGIEEDYTTHRTFIGVGYHF